MAGPKHLARLVEYCESELSNPDLGDERRAVLEAKRDLFVVRLGDHCRRCGRQLTDPESIARRLGPECAGRES